MSDLFGLSSCNNKISRLSLENLSAPSAQWINQIQYSVYIYNHSHLIPNRISLGWPVLFTQRNCCTVSSSFLNLRYSDTEITSHGVQLRRVGARRTNQKLICTTVTIVTYQNSAASASVATLESRPVVCNCCWKWRNTITRAFTQALIVNIFHPLNRHMEFFFYDLKFKGNVGHKQ